MSAPDPFDELGVPPGASAEEIQRAYRRRIVERHRRGIWSITDEFRRAQRALAALSDPVVRERYRRAREQRESERPEAQFTIRDRQLGLLRRYKSRMNRDLVRIGAENSERHATELAEIDRQIALDELRAHALVQRRRLAVAVRSALLLVLLAAVIAALWIGLRGG